MIIKNNYKSAVRKISLATTMGFVGFMTYVVPASALDCSTLGSSSANPQSEGT